MGLIYSAAVSKTDQYMLSGFDLNPATGYIDTTTFSVSYVDATRTYTITPIGTLKLWRAGVSYSITSPMSAVIPSNSAYEGISGVYFTGTGLRVVYLTALGTEFDILGAAGDDTPLTLLYWDATNQKAIYIGGSYMPAFRLPILKASFINYRLCTWTFGGAFSNFVIGDGSLNSHAQFQINDTRMYIGDFPTAISAINSTTECIMFYRFGAQATPVLRQSAIGVNQIAGFKVLNSIGTDGRLMYNNVSGGNYVLTQCTNNYFVNYFYFASSDYRAPLGTSFNGRFFGIPGIREYQNLADAVAEAPREISQFRNSFRLDQFYLLGAVHFQTNSLVYGNAVKAKVTNTTANLALNIYYTDLRGGGH